MSKFVHSGKTVALVVTEPEGEYIGVFEDEAYAEAFVREYRGGLLTLKVIDAPVYRYNTVEGV